MPIRRELRHLYPPNWRELSRIVRFERAGGRCQGCGRPHQAVLRCLPDGRWFDTDAATWRDGRGKACQWPDLVETVDVRFTRVILAAAHLDGNPSNNRLRNLRCLCQRCHVLHDVPLHTHQRWITYRRRWALGDLFLGLYGVMLDQVSARGFARWPLRVRPPSIRNRLGAERYRRDGADPPLGLFHHVPPAVPDSPNEEQER